MAGFAISGAALAAPPGPDALLTDIPDVANCGTVGTIAAVALGTTTCNVGDANLAWHLNGTPVMAMNAYRIKDGRLTQIGLGHCKTACCAGPDSFCAACAGPVEGGLGPGCTDTYGGGYTQWQNRLAPRFTVNAFTGELQGFQSLAGDNIFRRLQMQMDDLDPALNPGAQWFVEGVYISTDDGAAGNWRNNASYKRALPVGATGLTLVNGTERAGDPAIKSWHDHGLGQNVPDPSVTVAIADVPGEGRYYYAYAVRALGGGQWRYEYAIMNQTSDRSGGAFSVPIPAGVVVSAVGFHSPPYHSDEIYDNTTWTSGVAAGRLTWRSPATYAVNANTNALRWGTMYNFWFTASAPPAPTLGSAALDLFKPGTPTGISFGVQAPSGVTGSCYANCDLSTTAPVLNVLDFACYLNGFAGGAPYANCDGSTAAPVLNIADLICFLNRYAAGCS